MIGASSVISRMSTSSSLAAFVVLFALLAEVAALVVLAAVDVVDDFQDSLRRHQHRLDLGAELHPQIVERAHVQRIRHRHHHHVPLAPHGQQPVLLGEADGNPRRQIGVDGVDLQLGAVGNPQLLAQRLQHLLLGDGAGLDEDLAETAALRLLRDERLLDHRRGEVRVASALELEEQLADPFACHRSAFLREPAPGRGRLGPERRPEAERRPRRWAKEPTTPEHRSPARPEGRPDLIRPSRP